MQQFNHLLFVTRAYSFEILRPLYETANAAGHRVAWYVHEATAGVPPGDIAPRLADVAAVKAFDPAAVFVPGNWVPDFFPGLKVQVFHGFGIDKKGHFRIRGFFDLYCTHGPLTTSRFNELRKRDPHFQVRETGWPKMDTLFRPDPAAPALRGEGKPVILYAPTFSPAFSSAAALRPAIAELIANCRYRWLFKFHPRMDRAIVADYAALAGHDVVVVEGDIVPPLQAADLLLSDTSSVVAEFLLLDKPAVTFRGRNPGGFSLDIDTPADLAGAIDRALARPPELMHGARRYVDEMHPYRDGRSAARVLDATANFLNGVDIEPRVAKPLNIKRRLEARWRLRYPHWR